MTQEIYTNDIPSIHIRIKKQIQDFVTEEVNVSVKGVDLNDCETKLTSLMDKINRERWRKEGT